MSVTRYTLNAPESRLQIVAYAPMHRVEIESSGLSGWIELDVEAGQVTGGEIVAPLSDLTGGDRTKDRELNKFLKTRQHGSATLTLAPSDLTVDGSNVSFDVTGDMAFQGRTIPVNVRASGTLSDGGIRGDARFSWKLTNMGLKPPKLLFIKVKDDIDLVVSVRAEVAS